MLKNILIILILLFPNIVYADNMYSKFDKNQLSSVAIYANYLLCLIDEEPDTFNRAKDKTIYYCGCMQDYIRKFGLQNVKYIRQLKGNTKCREIADKNLNADYPIPYASYFQSNRMSSLKILNTFAPCMNDSGPIYCSCIIDYLRLKYYKNRKAWYKKHLKQSILKGNNICK